MKLEVPAVLVTATHHWGLPSSPVRLPSGLESILLLRHPKAGSRLSSCHFISIDSYRFQSRKNYRLVIVSLSMGLEFSCLALCHDLCLVLSQSLCLYLPISPYFSLEERRQKHQSAWILERCVSGVRQHVSRRLPRALQSKSNLDRPVWPSLTIQRIQRTSEDPEGIRGPK